MKRRSGFVLRYLTIQQGASMIEVDRREIWERVAIGEFPAMRSAAGQWIIPESALAAMSRRLCEHD